MIGVFYVLIIAALVWWLWEVFVDVCSILADRMSEPPNGQSTDDDESSEDVSNDNDDEGF